MNFFVFLILILLPLAALAMTLRLKARNMHNEEEIAEGGTFTVVGHDKAVFKLPGHHRPKQIDVDFDESCPPLVCNPHHHDHLEWEVCEAGFGHRHKYELHIKWHVSGVRKIRWAVVDG